VRSLTVLVINWLWIFFIIDYFFYDSISVIFKTRTCSPIFKQDFEMRVKWNNGDFIAIEKSCIVGYWRKLWHFSATTLLLHIFEIYKCSYRAESMAISNHVTINCYSIFSFMCMFCNSLFVLFSFFFCSLYCLSFFNLWILITFWYLQTLLRTNKTNPLTRCVCDENISVN
jgi:hypothetical protein